MAIETDPKIEVHTRGGERDDNVFQQFVRKNPPNGVYIYNNR